MPVYLIKSNCYSIYLKFDPIIHSECRNAKPRYEDDYFPFDESLYPDNKSTQFYPSFPIIQFPKIYNVNRNVDKDGCQKTFSSHTEFASGIFTIGKTSKWNKNYYVVSHFHGRPP